MALCIGSKPNGDYCRKKGSRETGYCDGCDPSKNSDVSISQELLDSIPKVETLQDLRKLELLLLDGIVTGAVDSRAGSSIAALCKHQAELILKLLPKGEKIDGEGREALIEISLRMSDREAHTLMQDFTGQFGKLLTTNQNKVIDVPTIEVKDDRRTDDEGAQRADGIPESAAASEDIF